jgi:hypothetical protein
MTRRLAAKVFVESWLRAGISREKLRPIAGTGFRMGASEISEDF